MISAWIAFFPHPRTLAVAIALALPWIIVGLCHAGGEFVGCRLEENGEDSSVVPALMFAIFALALRTLDVEFVMSGRILWLAAPLAGALLFGLTRSSFTSIPGGIIIPVLYAVLCFAYGGAAACQLDMLLDREAPREYRPLVISKHYDGGSRGSYWVKVSEWGPFPGENDINSFALYDRAVIGKPICVTAHPGAIGVIWYEATFCP